MNKLTIGILGAFQNGKSTLVNCLLERGIAKTGGYGINVTSINTEYIYGEKLTIILYNHEKVIKTYFFESLDSFIGEGALDFFIQRECDSVSVTDITITLPSKVLNSINILDTPGFNANEHDTSMALASLKFMDIAVLLIKNKGLDETEKTICHELNHRGIPFFIIMNCMDEGDNMWNPNAEQNHKIANNILSDLKLYNISPYPFGGERIWITNLLWYWHSTNKSVYSEIEQKQIKRIKCFFDLFCDFPSLSREQLKEKSLFVQLKDALQNSKNLYAIGVFFILARSFECHKKITHLKCTEILKELPYTISIKIRHLLECINRIRAEYSENEAQIEERKKQLANILHMKTCYVLYKNMKLRNIELKELAHEILIFEQRNKNIQMIERTYLDSINYLKSIYNIYKPKSNHNVNKSNKIS